VKGQEALNLLFQLQLRVFLLKQKIAAKSLVGYERNTTIMEAEEAEALKLHLFSSTWSFKWLT